MTMTKEKQTEETLPVAAQSAAISYYDPAAFDLSENMEGVEPRLPEVKIISAAAIFETPDGENPKEVTGVIVATSRVNAWWAKDMDEAGAGTPPDCFSKNGIIPHSEHREHHQCATCPQNKFGSDGGRGKACKNTRRLSILIGDDMLPHIIKLPATSLKAWDVYMVSLMNQKRHFATVMTTVSLAKKQNKDGITYSEAVFKMAGLVPDEELGKIAELRKFCAEKLDQEPIEIDSSIRQDDHAGQPDPY